MLTVSKRFLPFLAIPFITFAILLTSGCAGGPPTQTELAKADYGTPISQEDAQRQALEFLRHVLKDPDSAKTDWSPISPGWTREAPIDGGGLTFGYLLKANINAKNTYGAYIGYTPYKFLFVNGIIASVFAQQELSTGYSSVPYMRKIY